MGHETESNEQEKLTDAGGRTVVPRAEGVGVVEGEWGQVYGRETRLWVGGTQCHIQMMCHRIRHLRPV